MENTAEKKIATKKRGRRALIIILAILVVIASVIGYVACQIHLDGYYFAGSGSSTPEAALKKEAWNAIPPMDEVLTIKTHLDTLYLEDYLASSLLNSAILFYVSERDTICRAHIFQSKRGKWYFVSYSEESDLDNPTSFIMNGDPEQTIWSLFGFDDSANKVFGWKYSYAPEVLVNGIPTEKKTYKIEIDGKDRSVDYWWCIDQSLVSREDIVLTYAE